MQNLTELLRWQNRSPGSENGRGCRHGEVVVGTVVKIVWMVVVAVDVNDQGMVVKVDRCGEVGKGVIES